MKRFPMMYGAPGRRPDHNIRRWSRMDSRDRAISQMLNNYKGYKQTEREVLAHRAEIAEAVA